MSMRVDPRASSLARLDRLDPYRGFAPLAIRVFLGVFLLYMAQDNVFSAARMTEFERFLAANHVPAPALAARVSVYAQLVCGALVLVGVFTRWAALVMIVNFMVAIVGVHLKLPFRTFLEPCAMLACAVALFLGGPGRLAIDTWWARRSPDGAGSAAPAR